MKNPALVLLALALAPMLLGGEAATSTSLVPGRVHRNTPGHFPTRLLQQGVLNGSATVIVEIGPEGKIDDLLVTAYTHPEFGTEASRVVRSWSFEPSTRGGQPITSVITVEFEFTVNGMAVYERHPDSLRLDDYFARKFAYFPHGDETLDAKPTATTTAPPVYPEAWISQGHRGPVKVTFYIDETGTPRFPLAAPGSDELLAASAMAALKHWRFAPPLVKGKPALAFAEQIFVFEAAVTDSRM